MIGYANFRLWVPGGQVPRGWRGGGGGGDKRKDDRDFLPSFMWCHQESNRGHKDFQSFALPTELWHLALDCECKVIAFCRIHQIFSQLFFKNFNNWRKFAVHGAVDATGAYLRHAFLDISAIPAQIRKCRVVMNRGTTPGCSHLQPNIPCEVVARLRTTSGVRFGWGISFPACRHAPAWRNTGLRTAAIPCRGLRLPRRSTALPQSLCRRKRAQKRRARGHALVTKKFTYYELLFHCLGGLDGAIGEGGYHDVHALKRLE